MSNQEKLDKALKVVNDVIGFTSEIYNTGKKFFDMTDAISENFNEFQIVAEKTKQQLLHPELSIAMVGTTSAGKSTIVNSFAGRKIAPMEAKEMSAGVLEMTHSDKRTMKVHKTENATWAADFFDGISDKEIYEKTKEIFEEYHKKAGKVAAPKISVTGPLEWQANKSILDLPDNLNVKFVDLPGLKTLQDEKNLATIQEYLSKSFCIIAMDFNDVDNSRKQLLLNEVKDIVKSMNNTEFLMFILNKVDCVKAGQTTVDELISQLKDSIRENLNLDSEVRIFPFVAQLYYGIQSAFEKNLETGEIINFTPEKLKNIFTDCGSFFLQKVATNEITFEFYGKIQQMAFGFMAADMGLLRNFYDICFSLSGAENLFGELKRRIAESFFDIIIRPATDEFHRKFQELMDNMTTCVSISKNKSLSSLIQKKLSVINTKLFLEGSDEDHVFQYVCSELQGIELLLKKIAISEAELSNLQSQIQYMFSKVELRECGFIDSKVKSIRNNIDKIATKLSQTISDAEIVQFLEDEQAAHNDAVRIFNGITDVSKNIRTKLVTQYLDVFREFISDRENTADKFEAAMADVMSPSLAKKFKTPYETLYDFLYSMLKGFRKNAKSYTKKVPERFPEGVEQHYDETLVRVNQTVRNVLSKLTNIQFQIETNCFVNSIQEYLEYELDNIGNEIRAKMNDDEIDISKLLRNKLNVSKADIELPEELFKFSTPAGSVEATKIKTGTGYVSGGCCSSGYSYDKFADGYLYKYDNEVACYERWLQGVDEATKDFWTIINRWLNDQIDIYMRKVKKTSLTITNNLTVILNGQLDAIQHNTEIELQNLDNLANSIEDVKILELEQFNIN